MNKVEKRIKKGLVRKKTKKKNTPLIEAVKDIKRIINTENKNLGKMIKKFDGTPELQYTIDELKSKVEYNNNYITELEKEVK